MTTSEMNFNNKEPYIIAEIGVNHNGSIDNAKKLNLPDDTIPQLQEVSERLE